MVLATGRYLAPRGLEGGRAQVTARSTPADDVAGSSQSCRRVAGSSHAKGTPSASHDPPMRAAARGKSSSAM